MNCEKCKNKKATVFYADESGGRHSLCASCAASLGKISEYDAADQKAHGAPFTPTPTLTSLQAPHTALPSYCSADETLLLTACPHCSTSLESYISRGRLGCPECYTLFADSLLPSSLSAECAKGARMPSSRRTAIDRIRSINDLKSRLRIAVETENYELAATLRDEIRRLEAMKRA